VKDRISPFSKGRQLSRSELTDGCEVVVECLTRDNWPKDVRAIAEGEGIFRFTDPASDFEPAIKVAHWEGDILVHPNGDRFVFFELMRGEA
jgi:hypothetical protein